MTRRDRSALDTACVLARQVLNRVRHPVPHPDYRAWHITNMLREQGVGRPVLSFVTPILEVELQL